MIYLVSYITIGAGKFGKKKISNSRLVPFSLLNIKNSIPL